MRPQPTRRKVCIGATGLIAGGSGIDIVLNIRQPAIKARGSFPVRIEISAVDSPSKVLNLSAETLT